MKPCGFNLRLGTRMGGWILALLLAGLLPAAMAAPRAPDSASRALIIGIALYRDPEVSPLFGVPNDMDSAREIALALGIPKSGIRELFNQQATKAGITAALTALVRETPEDGVVLVYFSGHGTRWARGDGRGCVEGLLTWDRRTIVNSEFAEMVRPLGAKADKVLIMFDACHSGGVGVQTRSLGGESAVLRPKFFARAAEARDACRIAVNERTRSAFGPRDTRGALDLPPEYFIQITAARPDEVAIDGPGGGLATQGVRRCLVEGRARDLDGSGAVTLAEVEECANAFVRDRLNGNSSFLPHHVSVRGFRNFVPVPVTLGSAAAAAQAAVPPPSPKPPSVVTAPVASPPAVPAAPAAPSAEQLRLEQERLREERLARERREREAAEALARQRDELIRAERERLRREQAQALERDAERLRLAAEAAGDAAAATTAALPVTALADAEAALLALEAVAERERLEAAAATGQAAPPAPLGPRAALADLHAQRDPRHTVTVRAPKQALRIGVDLLDLTVESSRAGYLYVLLLGSDETTFTLLFPNSIDAENAIAAGAKLRLPRAHWQVTAAGPAGANQLLAIVSPTRRDLSALMAASLQGSTTFAYSAADLEGRQRLIDAFIGAGVGTGSRSFGAAAITLEETP